MSSPEERAQRRANMSIRLFRRGERIPNDLYASTTSEERLAMMMPLALELWGISGRPLPEYRREEMPVKLVRRR